MCDVDYGCVVFCMQYGCDFLDFEDCIIEVVVVVFFLEDYLMLIGIFGWFI